MESGETRELVDKSYVLTLASDIFLPYEDGITASFALSPSPTTVNFLLHLSE